MYKSTCKMYIPYIYIFTGKMDRLPSQYQMCVCGGGGGGGGGGRVGFSILCSLFRSSFYACML